MWWWWWRCKDIVVHEHAEAGNDSRSQSPKAHPSAAPNSVEDDIFGGGDTVVYTNEEHDLSKRFPYTYTEVTQKVASSLLNVKTAKTDAYCTDPPVQTLTYDINKDLKVWALRNRIFLSLNEMLLQNHNIKCRGPVVVSRCNTKMERIG